MMRRMIKKGMAVLLAGAMLLPVSVSAASLKNSDDAVELALKKVKDATVMEVEKDKENGSVVYEVELEKGNKEYSLVYRASDSKLMEYSWELIDKSEQKTTGSNLSKSKIKSKAKDKVSGASIVSVKLETDDGLTEYTVKLKKGSKRYELVYNAKSGTLLEYEMKVVK